MESDTCMHVLSRELQCFSQHLMQKYTHAYTPCTLYEHLNLEGSDAPMTIRNVHVHKYNLEYLITQQHSYTHVCVHVYNIHTYIYTHIYTSRVRESTNMHIYIHVYTYLHLESCDAPMDTKFPPGRRERIDVCSLRYNRQMYVQNCHIQTFQCMSRGTPSHLIQRKMIDSFCVYK